MIEIPMVLIQQIVITILTIIAISAQLVLLAFTLAGLKEKDYLFFLIGTIGLLITIPATLVFLGIIVIV